MVGKPQNDEYTDEEATRRMNEALRRALTSPAKPHSAMKFGKRKAKAEPKECPASKGRIHKDDWLVAPRKMGACA
ncbi:MAG: hypothetical protein WA624_05385 [Methylocella sp.]